MCWVPLVDSPTNRDVTANMMYQVTKVTSVENQKSAGIRRMSSRAALTSCPMTLQQSRIYNRCRRMHINSDSHTVDGCLCVLRCFELPVMFSL